MAETIQKLSPEHIKALVRFYESQTGKSSGNILSDLEHYEPMSEERHRRYIYGIMKNRFFERSVESQGITLIADARNKGVNHYNLEQYAKGCTSWTQFREKILELMKMSGK